MCRYQRVTGEHAKYLLSGFSLGDYAKFGFCRFPAKQMRIRRSAKCFKKNSPGVLFSFSLNRLIRNFLSFSRYCRRSVWHTSPIFSDSNPFWDFAQPDDLTSKKIFFSYLEGHKPGFLHADFVSSSNSKKPQQLERGASQRQRCQWYMLWS